MANGSAGHEDTPGPDNIGYTPSTKRYHHEFYELKVALKSDLAKSGIL